MWYTQPVWSTVTPEIDEMFTMHPPPRFDDDARRASARRRRHELAHAVARERKRRVLVERCELLGRRVAHVDARRADVRADVVHEEVAPPEALARRLDQRAAALGARDVRGDAHHFHRRVRGLDALREALQAVKP